MWRAILVCIILIAVLSSCTRDTAVYDPCPACPPNISFKSAIIPIFQANCAISGCHDAASHAYNVNLDSASAYSTVIAPGSGFIYNNTANQSILYNILIGTSNRMPPTGYNQLNPCQVQDIGCWINQGAQNN